MVSKDRQGDRVVEREGGWVGDAAWQELCNEQEVHTGSTWLNLTEVCVCMSKGPEDDRSSE